MSSGDELLVLDAGVGNLGNVLRALRYVGGAPRIAPGPEAVAAARTLVLPGVGAFAPPREFLRGAWEEALLVALASGAKLLGICVGFQLLFERGEEHGELDGLGLLAGRVTRLPETVRLPQIGWNRARRERPHPVLAGLEDASFYFVHGYAPEGTETADEIASTRHGRLYASVAGRGRVVGTQFHPEKSGRAGLQLLSNFLAWEPAGEAA